MKNSLKNKISENIFYFYIYYANLLIGWQIVSFIYLYQSTDTLEISKRLEKWFVFEPYLIGIGALITILLLILHRFVPLIHLKVIQGLPRQIMIQTFFLVDLFFNFLTIELNVHLDVFELFAFIFALWTLLKWGSIFYNAGLAGWMHPTTYGSFFVTALLLGCSFLSLFNLSGNDTSLLYYFLLVLLTFDLLIVYARFHYLSNFSQATVQIARKLMGSHILYFGARIILGIFMPAIFILYMVLINGGEIKGVEILILVGTIIDRFLFVNSVNMKV
jgi:hypothetical protein